MALPLQSHEEQVVHPGSPVMWTYPVPGPPQVVSALQEQQEFQQLYKQLASPSLTVCFPGPGLVHQTWEQGQAASKAAKVLIHSRPVEGWGCLSFTWPFQGLSLSLNSKTKKEVGTGVNEGEVGRGSWLRVSLWQSPRARSGARAFQEPPACLDTHTMSVHFSLYVSE